MKRSAFSLLEILVTLAIVAILVAIVFPAFQSLRGRAESAQCLANLRNIGVGLNSYLSEHGMILPEMAAARADRREDVPVIDSVLAPYVEDPRVFGCPADPAEFRSTGTSYYWNSALSGQPVFSLNLFGLITDQDKIPLLVDKEGWHTQAKRRINHLFADGHASAEWRLFAE